MQTVLVSPDPPCRKGSTLAAKDWDITIQLGIILKMETFPKSGDIAIYPNVFLQELLKLIGRQ